VSLVICQRVLATAFRTPETCFSIAEHKTQAACVCQHITVSGLGCPALGAGGPALPKGLAAGC